jgi:hypothetical protein
MKSIKPLLPNLKLKKKKEIKMDSNDSSPFVFSDDSSISISPIDLNDDVSLSSLNLSDSDNDTPFTNEFNDISKSLYVKKVSPLSSSVTYELADILNEIYEKQIILLDIKEKDINDRKDSEENINLMKNIIVNEFENSIQRIYNFYVNYIINEPKGK